MNNYAYCLFQLKHSREVDYAWMRWDYAKDKFDLNDYEGVYYSHIDAETEIEALNKLFEKFNIDHPIDFTGHSMSVSDVICLIRNDGCDWYYCDSFGWEKITKALAERRLRNE